ncbi:hypothetical protein HN51_014057 [Arachis hypogaea]|uniref:PUM-HD domain-containing protein n=1 Tax=Arachis hypogaea TaxID=3818 RepID=A0A445DMN3_ARAHY|nr:uncharacterized protein LOC107631631 [Arachis ipaensis]XP_025639540.1 uncharacterized protein LOC112734441 [Arachis hypogaea]QHO59928.1 uncharacterized protein DS421_3g103060 [Arachis hypogaea]RYR64450.1 hypothetical protein Ahy_A03g010559 [Arachis hypogaea]
MGKEMSENVKDDGELEELEMLLNEIPRATSHNLLHLYHRNRHVNGGGCVGDDDHHDHGHFVTQANHGMCGMYDDVDEPLTTQIQYPCVSSPLSGFSDGSSSSLFLHGGHSLSDTGSPTLEDLKSTIPSGSSCHPNPFYLDSLTPDSASINSANGSFADELGLCANLSQMCLGNQHDSPYDSKDVSMGMNGVPFRDSSFTGNTPINVNKHGDYCNFNREFLDSAAVQSLFPRSPINHGSDINPTLLGLTQDYKMANLFGPRQCTKWPETVPSQLNGFGVSMDSPRHRRQMLDNYYFRGNQGPVPAASLTRNSVVDAILCAQKNGMNLMEETCMSRLSNSSLCTNLRPYLSVQHSHPLSNARTVLPSDARIPQGNLDSITSEGSFILQGEGLNYVVNRGSDRSRCQNKAAVRGTGYGKHLRRTELDTRHQVVGSHGSPRSVGIGCSFPLMPKYSSLAEARGYIYLIAKDQHGCRFLQRTFEEGTPEDVQVIFNEIIDHVVELMMNPFGNYLMQKLLDVCSEEQRMQILLIITEERGQLVRISLNTHGTRVVQKLIETLKTRQQISLVVSALEPGFLALIKDLNGNHVVQRCLLCLNNEDNKFIFVAAAKYCVDIATHQHGCCVLQRCIGHSTGEHREKLIAEISANALLLSQDPFGNYVVQYILELGIPHATGAILLQFEGNYVHLSRQKFSSHVVEKCLAVFNDENRSRVIHELLSAPHFEHLLQDPHANYVVQSALRHSEGHLHNLLVETIESHKAISRNSPYSKKIFSPNLLRK